LKIFRFALVFLAFGVAATEAATVSCDRVCLKSALDQYLNALIKHDPAAAPLSPGFRQTENAAAVSPGKGLWQSAASLGKVQRRYLDPVSGQAGYFGTLEEKTGLAIVTLRLKVDQHQVTEAEWIVARKGDPGQNGPQVAGQTAGNFFDPENLAANPPTDTILPKTERLPREALIGIANSYFDGLSGHDGSLVSSHTGCARIENGFTVTGRPLQNDPSKKTDCASNLQQFNVQFVAARRFPIVDEEAGVVLGMGIFIRRPGTTARRNVLSEWFAIDNKKIRTIHAAMFYPAHDVPVPNWPPYNGNWPLPPSLAPAPQQ
jgi:hypothetical protein